MSESVFGNEKRPLVLIIMDGVGYSENAEGNAVKLAETPTLDMLDKNYPRFLLKAHGQAVGLPSDEDMGNSEVGHNALGAGQVFAQGAKLVNRAIESGRMFGSDTWNNLIENCKTNNSTLHFLGLFSDGNVHSHINHLKAMITEAKRRQVKRVRIHILLDGRDVGETSALDYVLPFEEFLASLNDNSFDVKIASGGGRMVITMDRYEANWHMVELGWNTHVLGEGRQFSSAEEAITAYRKETGKIDQDLPPFVIAKDGKPVGAVNDGDSVIFYNFRGDRAIEISKAFENRGYKFTKKKDVNVMFAGMLEYDGDEHIPHKFLVPPPEITNTMGEFLVKSGYRQLAVSETQKYGHVTYFWNGNRTGKFSDKLEEYIEIPSDIVPFEQRPWMKCAEITDVLIEKIKSGKFDFLRCNFPNGDMVGHTGSLTATKISMEALDLCLARILKAVDEVKGIAIITADHGNADEMYEIDKKTGKAKHNADGSIAAKTSHTLNKVPCYFYDNYYKDNYTFVDGDYGLSNVAATVVTLMGETPPPMWDESMVKV
ncbi:MAG: 2,3-bisphosphoglycerate-independent phosphoglycerate mutase [Clostridiales bacterium]|nr:2,3-bisphosphoglycerate-independent phosphoglycerate mutase [Clostridiales bacterium]